MIIKSHKLRNGLHTPVSTIFKDQRKTPLPVWHGSCIAYGYHSTKTGKGTKMMSREQEFDQDRFPSPVVVGMYCKRCGTAYVLCHDGYIRAGNMQTNCGVVCMANNDGTCSQIMELQGGPVLECRGQIIPEMTPGNDEPELISTCP